MRSTQFSISVLEYRTDQAMTERMKPMDLGEMRTDKRWPQVERMYVDGYHDAKDGDYRNEYPKGTLRWHAYECGWITADNFFNKQQQPKQ